MKLFFIVALCALPLALGLAQLIENDAGYVLIAYQSSMIEMSVWVGLILMLVLFFSVYPYRFISVVILCDREM